MFYSCEIPGPETDPVTENPHETTPTITFTIKPTNKTIIEPTTSPNFDSTTMATTEEPKCCPQVSIRGLNWNKTCEQGTQIESCPKMNDALTKGDARWTCLANGNWFPSSPDLSDCKSDKIANFLDKLNISDIESTLKEIDVLSAYISFGGDIIDLTDVLDRVTRNLELYIQRKATEERSGSAENATEQIVNCTNNLISNEEFWEDIPEEKRPEIGTKLLEAVDRTGFQLAYVLNQTQITMEEKNIVFQVMKQSKSSLVNEGLKFPLSTSNDDNQIILPVGFVSDIPTVPEIDDKYVYAVYSSISNMRKILKPKETEKESFSENSTVNSLIQSLSLAENVSIKLTNEVYFILKHIDEGELPNCTYWNSKSFNWDSAGCRLVESNSTHTQCACDHLTNFAVIMDVHNSIIDLSESDLIALEVITLVGCILSIICLAACIVIATVFKSLWGVRNTIHRCLCICLLLAEVILITGLKRTENNVICSVVGGLLFYLFMAAFCWMLLESVYIYLLLYKVFQAKHSYKNRYLAFGFGCPLVIVGVSAGVNPGGFSTENYCWLSTERGMIWSFVGPALLVLMINLCTLIYALRTAMNASNKKPQPKTNAMKAWIKGSLTLVPLLGLNWLLGFLVLKDSVAGAYIFTILNSLQGVAIFIVQCIMNKKTWDKISGIFRSTSVETTTTRTDNSSGSPTSDENSPPLYYQTGRIRRMVGYFKFSRKFDVSSSMASLNSNSDSEVVFSKYAKNNDRPLSK